MKFFIQDQVKYCLMCFHQFITEIRGFKVAFERKKKVLTSIEKQRSFLAKVLELKCKKVTVSFFSLTSFISTIFALKAKSTKTPFCFVPIRSF